MYKLRDWLYDWKYTDNMGSGSGSGSDGKKHVSGDYNIIYSYILYNYNILYTPMVQYNTSSLHVCIIDVNPSHRITDN